MFDNINKGLLDGLSEMQTKVNKAMGALDPETRASVKESQTDMNRAIMSLKRGDEVEFNKLKNELLKKYGNSH